MEEKYLAPEPVLCLAPMAGLTHAAFRELAAEFGGSPVFFTEMLNVRAIVYQNPEKDPYLICGERDQPLVAQLVGREPELFAQAVERLETLRRFDGYDLNFGCSRGAIQRYGWGVALMEEPVLACAIAKAVCQRTSKPVSAKLRSGRTHDRQKLLALAKGLEEAGIRAIILHPRAAKDGFKRPARWEEIAFLAENLSIPVIGNGDVFSPEDASRLLEKTKAFGVMIGRAALLRPWIFRDTRDYWAGKPLSPPPEPIRPLKRLAELINRYLPESIQEKRFELYLFWYLQNFPYGLHYFGKVQRVKGLRAKLALLEELLACEGFRPYPAKPYLLR